MEKQIITRAMVMNYWTRQINSRKETYKDECGEKDYTRMGEDAARHFEVATDTGDTNIEHDIFDWATELHF